MRKPKRQFIPCTLRQLPAGDQLAAAATAVHVNPANMPLLTYAATMLAAPEPMAIAVLTSKYWGAGGVKLGVAFIDNPPRELRTRILAHMNAWGDRANVLFSESTGNATVRIDRGGSGYWSYLGTDVLHIRDGEPTMNLQGFSMSTPDAEFYRVVRHETGHTLGFPHEHMRRAVVARLDEAKTIAYFRQTQGWSEQQTRQQVLTPLEESALIATPQADEDSIMCYQLPGSITRDGRPVTGGDDLNASDREFAAKIYPKADAPPPPTGLPALKGKGGWIGTDGVQVSFMYAFAEGEKTTKDIRVAASRR